MNTKLTKKMLIQPKEVIAGVNCVAGKLDKCYTNVVGHEFLLDMAGVKIVFKGEEKPYYYCVIGNNCEPNPPKLTNKESYSLVINEYSVIISASDIAGFGYGLKALIRLQGESEKLSCMTINDSPSLEFRALHMCSFNPNDGTQKEDTSFASLKKMIKTIAIAGYNYVFIEFWGIFPYQKNKFACIKNSPISLEDVGNLVNYAIDDLKITPLPCQNMASHAGWSRIASRQHVALDQAPEKSDMWIPGGWCFATENPATKQYLIDCMQELITVFRHPPYFHVSCDKCFGFGSADSERVRSADELFTRHINFLHDELAKLGAKMVMWGDMIYSSIDELYWKANSSIIDDFPKDILFNVWTHNDIPENWLDVDFFQDRKYQTVYSPFLDLQSIKHMVEQCERKNSMGLVQTTWHKLQTALVPLVYSIALQWGGHDAKTSDAAINAFIAKFYN